MAKRAPWLWPLVLMAGGIVLLLDNFLLISLDLTPYWPILLVVLGLQVLVRGDIALSWQTHTFGITRGSVDSAAIEVESGELDVQLHALHKPGRLIAGQYTARSRPDLRVRNNRATLRMQRGQTWWLSMADWDVGLANDLPWDVLMSSYLGDLQADLHDLDVERAYVSSGIGSVSVTCPRTANGPIFARSAFGNVRIAVPLRSRAVVRVKSSPFGRVRIDSQQFTEIEPGLYANVSADDLEADTAAIDIDISASTVFGSIYIS